MLMSSDNHDIISVKVFDMGLPQTGTVAEVSIYTTVETRESRDFLSG